jgi:hypothetical protein
MLIAWARRLPPPAGWLAGRLGSCDERSPLLSLFSWPSEDACFSFSFRSDWATADFALGIGSLAELETPGPFAKSGCRLWHGETPVLFVFVVGEHGEQLAVGNLREFFLCFSHVRRPRRLIRCSCLLSDATGGGGG